MEYIKDGGTLPVPFNIIPTPKAFYISFKKIIDVFKKKKKQQSQPKIRIEENNLQPIRNGGKKIPSMVNNVTEQVQNVLNFFLIIFI